MNDSRRRVTYKLYPTVAQALTLDAICDLHRTLYNAALQERRDAWRLSKKSISYADQCKSVTQIRRDDIEYLGLNAQSLQVTLKRLDHAFGHFFDRVAIGQKPGFPRFKGKDRFPGFGYKAHGDGFKFEPGPNWKHGKLRLSGVGTMRARGEARTPGKIVCCNIMRKSDGWFISLVVACDPYRERLADLEGGLDWGVETQATFCYGPMDFAAFQNDRLLRQEEDAIAEAQRALSKKQRGTKRTKAAAKAKTLLAKKARHLANRRKDRDHQQTAEMAATHSLIVTEELSIKNMTASARGTVEEPGCNIAQKAGLNRAILDTSPGRYMSFLTYKVAETGGQVIFVDPRKHRSSQTDPINGSRRKKPLSERRHTLPDRRVIGRDEAAAWNLWNIGKTIKGEELARSHQIETAARAA